MVFIDVKERIVCLVDLRQQYSNECECTKRQDVSIINYSMYRLVACGHFDQYLN